MDNLATLKSRKQSKSYEKLLAGIGECIESGRLNANEDVNSVLINTYWNIGKLIADFEQESNRRALIASKLLNSLSKDLRPEYGSCFNRRNLYDMKRLYQEYSEDRDIPAFLNWRHFCSLLNLDSEEEKEFYTNRTTENHWSSRELKRQIDSSLFHRYSLSTNKEALIDSINNGHIFKDSDDIYKEDYILEFLGMGEHYISEEEELEHKIMNIIQVAILEAASDFRFVGRHKAINVSNKQFFVDLVFYHTALKYYLLVEIRIGDITYQDIGLMNLFLNYFHAEENEDGDTLPIGLMFGIKHDKIETEFALGAVSTQQFLRDYSKSIPDVELFSRKIKELL